MSGDITVLPQYAITTHMIRQASQGRDSFQDTQILGETPFLIAVVIICTLNSAKQTGPK